MNQRFHAFALVVAVLTLAACTAVPDAAPSGTPVAAPSPTAGAAVQGDPLPLLPLTCSDVFTDAAASALIFSPVSLKVDELTVRNTREIASLQAGLFRCTWGGQYKTDNSWDQSIVLDVLADGASAFDAGVWQINDGAIVYPDGSTTSEYLCPYVDAGYAQCFANVLVNGYWAHASVSTGGGAAALTRGALEASMRTIVDTLAATISAAGPSRAVWVAPAGVLEGAVCGGQPFPGEAPYPPQAVAVQRAGAVSCAFAPSATITVVPGGAWAMERVSAQSPSYAIGNLQAVQISGADAAFWGCGDGCYAILTIGGSAVSITDYDLYDGPAFLAELPGIVNAIGAAG